MERVNLDAEGFESFLRCLILLKDFCHDADIRNGIIRQREDQQSAVFEIDMSSLIGELSLPIDKLKNKVDMLKCFNGQEVEIRTTEREFIFSDDYSELKIENPRLDYLNNRFMSPEEVESIFPMLEEDNILSCMIPAMISDRMRTITQGFDVNNIQVNFNGEEAELVAATRAKDQSAKFMSRIETNRVMTPCYSNLVAVPFIIDHDGDTDFRMYNSEEHGNMCVNKFFTSIGDIDITIYGRSSLYEYDEE